MSRQLAVTGAALILLVGCGSDETGGGPQPSDAGSQASGGCALGSSEVSEYCDLVLRARAQIQQTQALIDRFRGQQQQVQPNQLADLTAQQLNQYTQQYPGAPVTDLIAAQQEVQRQRDAEIQRQASEAAIADWFAGREQAAERWIQDSQEQRKRDAELDRAFYEKQDQLRLEKERRAQAEVQSRQHEFNSLQTQAAKDRLDAAKRAEINP